LAAVPPNQLGGGVLHDLSQAVGQRLRRPLDAGQAVIVHGLTAPTLVRRGQDVTLEARAGQLAVRTAGVALKDGALGDLIPVENPSGRVVEGIVRTAKSVEILLR
jgi:flagella basal body P-ring formation protein FlgA